MFSYLDLENWNRKEHFEFFCQMEEPFFGIVSDLDCTIAYDHCKQNGFSFFAFYLHKILTAINEIENFKYRIKDDKILIYDVIDASATISRADTTFGFSFMKFDPNFDVFQQIVTQETTRVLKTSGIFTTAFPHDNLIHFSALPWVKFTALSHCRSFAMADSCPKISVGKMTTTQNGSRSMPISIHAHHRLADGYHIGLFLDKLQNLLNELNS
jgi:chloramphenicol O-acetyltransferase type A